MIDTASRWIVGLVEAGHRQRLWLSGAGLVVTLVVTVAYLINGALGTRPLESSYRITVQLPESGGLLADQDVPVRGVPVGRIKTLTLTADGVDAVAAIKSRAQIPIASEVRISGLSAAGEQYIDFQPESNSGPFFADGSVVDRARATVPVPLAQLLADADGALQQVDPQRLELIKNELGMTEAGPAKLADVIDGGSFLLSTLDSVLPETASLLRSSRTVFTMLGDVNNGISATAANVSHILDGVNEMDGGYRRFVDQAPELMTAVDNLFDDNSETMVGLLGNLVSAAQLLYLRTPALNALFPDFRGSTLEAVMTAMHDHGIWATGDIYPRYTCDYGTPRRPPSSADYPEPFMYTYCRDDDPELLIRGAKNAPRPVGDDTAGPPPGADLGKTTDETPEGRYTIPTPYGGPTLPIQPPR